LHAAEPAARRHSAGAGSRVTAVIVHFYQLDRAAEVRAPELDQTMRFATWQPDRDGLPLGKARRAANYAWWLLAWAGGFSRSGFAELRIESGGIVVQRLIVTPRWRRFPFMGGGDLQVGDVWTSPEHRRRGLARIALAEANRRYAREGTTIWYVVEAGNEGSAALARSCGYRRVAVGRRTRRVGTALLGQYVIDRFV
jgi:RimJ/RimL family protein N-acetyltransferase